MNFSTALQVAFGTASNAFSGAKPPQQLDPICVIFWLAMATWEPKGAKPSISNHRFTYDYPGESQAAERAKKGVSRNDLGLLSAPLKKVRYLWANDHNPDLIEILKVAKLGLVSISETYEDCEGKDTTLPSLEGFSRIIDDCINGDGGKEDGLSSLDNQEKEHWNSVLRAANTLFKEKRKESLSALLNEQQDKYLTAMQTHRFA